MICYSENMIIKCSSAKDGSMKHGGSEATIRAHRRQFLEKIGCNPNLACLVQLGYEGDDFCRYSEIDQTNGGEGVTLDSRQIADGLLTRTPSQALFLPLADCIGAVLWDKSETALMLNHLGRHNLEQQGAAKSIEYFCTQVGTVPQDMHVYLSAAASGKNYPLYHFNGRSLHDVALEQLKQVGVTPTNITIDSRDTPTDKNLYSHSEFLKGNRSSDGRFMIVACLSS